MITLISHGFKFSRPEANIVFDVSYFANPWRDKSIREETNPINRREKIIAFMNAQPGITDYVERVTALLASYDQLFPDENIQVAFCCSAGEYRSPTMVELVKEALEQRGIKVQSVKTLNSKLN